SLSGRNHTTFDLTVYASQDGSPHHHARLASGCWSSFARRDSYPAGFQRKVSEFKSLPPFQSLPDARTFLIVAASCPVCGEPVCLHRSTYQNNYECPLRLPTNEITRTTSP